MEKQKQIRMTFWYFLFLIAIIFPFHIFFQQGHSDYPLTEDGIMQAEKMGELLSEKEWDRVYSSDLGRAARSADLIMSKSAKWDRESLIHRSPLVRELHFGVREGLSRQLTAKEAKRIRAAELKVKENEIEDTAESKESAKARQHKFLEQLYHEFRHHNSEENPLKIACISHGGFIRLFLNHYCKHESAKIKNCAASIINIKWNDISDPSSYQCEVDEREVNLCPLSSPFVP